MLSREASIGIGVSAIALGAMAVDHLLADETDVDDDFPVDPFTFFLSAGISLALAALVFGLVVPRTPAGDPQRAARRALGCGVLAVVSLPLVWLGPPFPLAGGAIALGLRSRERSPSGRATASAALGIVVVLLGAGAYVGVLVEKLA